MQKEAEVEEKGVNGGEREDGGGGGEEYRERE